MTKDRPTVTVLSPNGAEIIGSGSLDIELESGVAADSDGKVTLDPHKAAAVMPTGSYKGYGLASMVDILCGVYTGMPFGRAIPAMFTTSMSKQRRLGQFYIVMRSDGVISHEEFIGYMQKMTDEVRTEPSIDGGSVMMPGDPQIICAKKRMKDGIPLDDSTFESLAEMSSQNNVKLKFL